MAESTVYAVALGFFLGGALKDFLTTFSLTVVAPVLGLLSGVEKSVNDVVIQVGSVKLEVGKAISSFFVLLIALLVASLVLPYVRAYAPKIGGRS